MHDQDVDTPQAPRDPWTAEGIVSAITALAQPTGKGKRKSIVICFTDSMPIPAEGHMIDSMLQCQDNEKGFLLPIRHRDEVLAMLQALPQTSRMFSFGSPSITIGSPQHQGQLFDTTGQP